MRSLRVLCFVLASALLSGAGVLAAPALPPRPGEDADALKKQVKDLKRQLEEANKQLQLARLRELELIVEAARAKAQTQEAEALQAREQRARIIAEARLQQARIALEEWYRERGTIPCGAIAGGVAPLVSRWTVLSK